MAYKDLAFVAAESISVSVSLVSHGVATQLFLFNFFPCLNF